MNLESSASRFTLHASRGFTLIELLMVMLVIVILTGAVFSSVGYVNRKAADSRTHALLAKISIALENYKADWGEYPLARSNDWARSQAWSNFNSVLLTNLAGLATNSTKNYLAWNWDETNFVVSGGVIGLYVVDGFGSPIAYDPRMSNFNSNPAGTFPNGKVNRKTYDLWSFGADLKSDSTGTMQDDIKNWD